MNLKVESSKIIIVEGSHDKAFFLKLMEKNNITGIQVMDIGGKTNLCENLRLLIKDPLFPTVTSIGITRDADDDFARTFECVQGILRNVNLPAPDKPVVKTQTTPAISIFVLPDNKSAGALEDICLDSVRNFPTYNCVERYMDCVQQIQGFHPHYSKSAVQVFLAKENAGDVSMAIASALDVWPWTNASYKDILEFIRQI